MCVWAVGPLRVRAAVAFSRVLRASWSTGAVSSHRVGQIMGFDTLGRAPQREYGPDTPVHSRRDGVHDGSEFPAPTANGDSEDSVEVTLACRFHADVRDAALLQGGGWCVGSTSGKTAPSAGHRPRRAGRVKGGVARGPRAPHSTVGTRCPPGTLDPTTTTSRAASTRKPDRSRVRATRCVP